MATDFDAAREAVSVARDDTAAARDALTAARVQARRATAAQTAARRVLPENDQELARLEAEAARAAEAAERAGKRLDAARERVAGAISVFADLADPRTELERLAPSIPILLFPVRMETRFRTDLPTPHLWVRIFPDTCLIDTFEESLAEVEFESARRYWQGIWRAAGDEDGERGAWRGLVDAHGSGRAGWIVDRTLPANDGDRPHRADPTDVFLIVTLEAPLSAADATDVATFWRAAWRAGDQAAGVGAARAALAAAVGAARAAELEETTRPYNFDDEPARGHTRTTVASAVAFLILPSPPATKDQTWTQAPRVDLLPDRFVLIAEHGQERVELIGNAVPSPLIVGPDPFATGSGALGPDGEDLAVPDELAWMTEFGRAVDDGLGFRVKLTPEQARRGFARLTVLGVRMSADDQQGAHELEALLAAHRRGRSGLSVLPQGTPTNNTEAEGSGHTRADDADASFEDRRNAPLFTLEGDARRRRDGQWLADALGIAPAALTEVHGAGGTDQREARAMQTALWPATLGYFLDTMMEPVIGDRTIDHARWFFTGYVSGRGALPALRIGMQPYGVLPATAYSRIGWLPDERGIHIAATGTEGRATFLRSLHAMLLRVSADWEQMAEHAPAVGRPGDAHETLLGILGLHPSSVEYQYRYAESLEHLYNHLNYLGLGGVLIAFLMGMALDQPALQLLRDLGADPEQRPAIMDKYFLGRAAALTGPVIDDAPLSETAPIRVWTPDGRNYLRWLTDAARSSLDAVRIQSGFTGDAPPRALLYLLLRHALMLGYANAGRRLYRTADFPAEVLQAMRREPPFLHIASAGVSESRFEPLYRIEPAISTQATVAEHVTQVLTTALEADELREQVEAIDVLQDVPTARLERLLAEHVDCSSYRYDAWRLGFAHLRLQLLRAASGPKGDNGDGPRAGIHLGAYGWLEPVAPKPRTLTPVELTEPDLNASYTPDKDPVLRRDSANGGFIHAPSLNHAVTASVLRSGYLANASTDEKETLAVNLSSERVRRALDTLEGIRQGQSLGELLGYRLERGLHDRHDVEIDKYIYELRRAFPLRANKLRSTVVEAESITEIEARNVVDGRRLVEHVQKEDAHAWPYDVASLSNQPTDPTPAQRTAIDAEVQALIDVNDSLGDLALAEGVHQAVQGNAERAAATIETFTAGQHPPEPDVIRTPAVGVTLTQRVGLHLKPGLAAPATDPTPRGIAEPAVNEWAAGVLPAPAGVGCVVHWDDQDGNAQTLPVTLHELHLQPLDLLELLGTREPAALVQLNARVIRRWRAASAPRPDVEPRIAYMEAGGAALSVFEVTALATHVRSLLIGARPLRPTDVALPNEAQSSADLAVDADPTRITDVKQFADDLNTDAAAFATALGTLTADQPARRAEVVAGIDGIVHDAIELLERGTRLAIGQSVWEFADSRRRLLYADLVERITKRLTALDDRLQQFDALVTEYDTLPGATPDDERLALLKRANGVLAPATLLPPGTPLALRPLLDPLKADFVARRGALEGVLTADPPQLSGLVALTAAALPQVAPIDTEPLSITRDEDLIVALAADLVAAITSLRDETKRRSDAAAAALAVHGTADGAPAKVAALQDAVHALLGDGFLFVPEFRLSPEHGGEWQQALAASTSGALLAHLATETEIEFGVDEWLYGVARVRAPLRHLEQTILLAEGLDTDEPVLVPIQLPFVPGEGWLALDFPAGKTIAGDRVLYTAVYHQTFAPAAAQCGLLLDEWTEVVPGTVATTGLAFHYDQSNSEAPQALMLALPTRGDGTWRWEDLTAALVETMTLARQRAVEPEQIDDSANARFLPATVMAATRSGLSIATVLAINSGIAERLKGSG